VASERNYRACVWVRSGNVNLKKSFNFAPEIWTYYLHIQRAYLKSNILLFDVEDGGGILIKREKKKKKEKCESIYSHSQTSRYGIEWVRPTWVACIKLKRFKECIWLAMFMQFPRLSSSLIFHSQFLLLLPVITCFYFPTFSESRSRWKAKIEKFIQHHAWGSFFGAS
jgi:hypothetical protein